MGSEGKRKSSQTFPGLKKRKKIYTCEILASFPSSLTFRVWEKKKKGSEEWEKENNEGGEKKKGESKLPNFARWDRQIHTCKNTSPVLSLFLSYTLNSRGERWGRENEGKVKVNNIIEGEENERERRKKRRKIRKMRMKGGKNNNMDVKK